jgi:hypothetical protein
MVVPAMKQRHTRLTKNRSKKLTMIKLGAVKADSELTRFDESWQERTTRRRFVQPDDYMTALTYRQETVESTAYVPLCQALCRIKLGIRSYLLFWGPERLATSQRKEVKGVI